MFLSFPSPIRAAAVALLSFIAKPDTMPQPEAQPKPRNTASIAQRLNPYYQCTLVDLYGDSLNSGTATKAISEAGSLHLRIRAIQQLPCHAMLNAPPPVVRVQAASGQSIRGWAWCKTNLNGSFHTSVFEAMLRHILLGTAITNTQLRDAAGKRYRTIHMREARRVAGTILRAWAANAITPAEMALLLGEEFYTNDLYCKVVGQA